MKRVLIMTFLLSLLALAAPVGAKASDTIGPYPGPTGGDVETARATELPLQEIEPGRLYSLWMVDAGTQENCSTPGDCTVGEILLTVSDVDAHIEHLGSVLGDRSGSHLLASGNGETPLLPGLLEMLTSDASSAESRVLVIDHGTVSPDAVSGQVFSPNDDASETNEPEENRPPRLRFEGTPGFQK